MDLRERILTADPTLKVKDIVRPKLLSRLPKSIARQVGAMKIDWQPNRLWGISYQLGDATIRLGHKLGDHVASFPHVNGLSDAQAGEVLRIEVEGPILHETGHAVFDRAMANSGDTRGWYMEAARAAVKDGAPSTYRGQCVGGRGDALSTDDKLHEMFAEAFRYWCHHDRQIAQAMPTWTALCSKAVAALR